jgi:AcrR family transcriptional regulator
VRKPSVEQRRSEILDVTCQVIIERGFGAARISDVAAKLGVSTGLIHYHFDSKDQLLAEAFRWAAEADLSRLHAEVERGRTAVERLERLISLYGHVDAEPDWMLWIDGWGEALRDPTLQHISQELDVQWQQVVAGVIEAGVAAGEFCCSDAEATAWRLTALLDGLGLQVTVHEGVLTRDQLLRYVRTATAAELGLPEAAFERAAKKVARDVA